MVNNPLMVLCHVSGLDYIGQNGNDRQGFCNFDSVTFCIRAFLCELEFLTADDNYGIKISELVRFVCQRFNQPHLKDALKTALCDSLNKSKSSYIYITRPLEFYKSLYVIFNVALNLSLSELTFDIAYGIFVENRNVRHLFEV